MLKEYLEKIKIFIKMLRNKPLIAISLLGIVVFLVIVALTRYTPEEEPESEYTDPYKTPVTQTNTYIGLTPGKSKFSDITPEEPNLGKYERRVIINNLHVRTYDTGKMGTRRNEVASDSAGIIKYMRIPVLYSQALPVTAYEEKLGLDKPDLIKWDKRAFFEKVFVYLDEGVALNVHDGLGVVYSEMYFEPMSQENFMRIWGNRNLVDNPPTHTDGPYQTNN